MRSFYALKMVFGGDKFRRGKDEGFMAPKKTKVRDENVSSAATAFSAIDKELLGLDLWKCVISRRLVCFLLFIC